MFAKLLLVVLTGMVVLISCSHLPSESSAPKNSQDFVNFTVPGVDDVPDLWGNPSDPDLVVFFGGNEFMVLPELLAAFKKEYPQYQRIFCETLPPGILAEQLAKGSLMVGNLEIPLRPDVITGGKERIEKMKRSGEVSEIRQYAQNRLAIMVREGNPKRVTSLKDLQRPDVQVAMPDKRIEDIGKKIEEALRSAGGDDLVEQVLSAKVSDGSTFVTRIHHRQTPMRIINRQSDAGPVWTTEALYQQKLGQPIEGITIPATENVMGTSMAAIMKDAPHPKAARDFLEFLAGPRAQQVYRNYGFLPPTAD